MFNLGHDSVPVWESSTELFLHQVIIMKLRSLPSLLLSTSSLLFYLIDLCNSAAPADLPSGCPTVSTNQRALLDSCCYSTLLPDLWNVADEDRDGITVSETVTVY